MKDMQREILSQVATGQISAGEGAARLEALGASEPPSATAVQPALPVPATAAGARSVRVVCHLGSATVVGDPTVAVASAEGQHTARQDGDTMVIELGLLGQDDAFSFGFRRQRDGLVVRMNPDLALQCRVRAGSTRIVGVHGPINAEVQAGDCRIEDFQSELNAFVQAGSISAVGRLDRGASKIRCQMGEVKLNLQKGSSVRISAHPTFGDVSIDGASVRRGESGSDVIVGAGGGTLELECGLGDIKVYAE